MPTKVTSKGQVTIPKRVRETLGLRKGSQVEFVLEQGYALMEPVNRSGVEAAAGALRRYSNRRRSGNEKEMTERVRREVADDAAREGRSSRHKRAS